MRKKQSFYFPVGMLAEIVAEAKRLDRPISFIFQRAWKLARQAIREMPSVGSNKSGG
jgi:uncharacterized small protein (TIGR04563 family)